MPLAACLPVFFVWARRELKDPGAVHWSPGPRRESTRIYRTTGKSKPRRVNFTAHPVDGNRILKVNREFPGKNLKDRECS